MESQLTSTKGTLFNWIDRTLASARLAWNRSTPLYLRYGVPYFLGAGTRMEIEAEGARFCVRPHSFDLCILSEVFELKAYEPRLEPLAGPQTVVDLGANIGAFSIWAMNRWSPEKILAVEMEPENFALLQENLDANPGKDVAVLQAAVWDRVGSVRIHRHDVNRGMHEVQPESGELIVPSTTLAGLLAAAGLERVDFLKVDIEGAEKRLFTPENSGIFSTRVGYIAAELHPTKGVNVAQVVRYMQAAGFAVAVRRQPANRAIMMEAINRHLG